MNVLSPVSITFALALLLGYTTVNFGRAAESRHDIVAKITDLQGQASVRAGGDLHAASILTEIAADHRIDLSPDSILVVLWLQSGEEFTFVGPAAIRFGTPGPQVISGASPTRRPSALEKLKGVRIRANDAAQATIIMRSPGKTTRIQLLNLAGTYTLDPQPEFRWQPIPGVSRYRFELSDATGRTLLEVDVAGDSYRLPATLQLEENATYTWELSTRLPAGRKYATAGDFKVAPAARRQEVEDIRPSADATLAERVAFALWLDQQGLRDEARKYWKDAAVERPEDRELRRLAGE